MPSRPFRRLLIANRGEIAVRVARAAAGLGIDTVAVHSAADAMSLHTRVADRSIELPGGPIEAYLDIDAVIEAATDNGCDAVHPGYGLLAENPTFARRCESAGLAFVGPTADALELLGNKATARQFAAAHGVPIVPGSDGVIASADEAVTLAQDLGYPVMLKAAAGGGGRGMRRVDSDADMPGLFEAASREAAASFGDGSLLIEKLLVDPRHIEVQILGDHAGTVVHLWERDCSLQQRHQKIVEIAPAPNLPDEIRAGLLADAVRLGVAGGYSNAGTIEFLVDTSPGGGYWFIEANPRIQVEHTITEEITGVDLVESQLMVAAGATLADLGLPNQSAVGTPRRAAVQARVVLSSGGTLSGYREPSGPGIRVDGYAYAGYTPVAAFDPLLAKVISSAPARGRDEPLSSYRAALDRAARALDEFNVDGATTNLDLLGALLRHETVRAGDARTTLIDALPHGAAAEPGAAVTLFRSANPSSGPSASSPSTAAGTASSGPALVAEGDLVAVAAPVSAVTVEVLVEPGAEVTTGQPLLITSAMKMETILVSPCDGVVAELLTLEPGSMVDQDQIVALIEPGETTSTSTPEETPSNDGWKPTLAQAEAVRGFAHQRLAETSDDPGVVRQRSRGKLTCRERIDLLVDDGSFREVGSLTGFTSYDADGNVSAFTPSNHVGGWGAIDHRQAIVCADDFTSRGGHADGSIASKSTYLERLSIQMRVPSVRLLDGSSGGGSVAAMVPSQSKSGESTAKESTGAIDAGKPRVTGPGGSFLPPHLGASMFARQLDTVPVVNMLLGSVVGLGAAKAVLGHFSVMLRDTAQLFVAGPPVVIQATGEDITKEDLGGWHIHCRNGSVDNLAEDEEDAAAQVRRFLSYLPSSVYEPAPIVPSADRGDARVEELLGLIPRSRTTTFDIRRAIELIVDPASFFEIGPHWGTDQVAGFARCKGHTVGIVASDSRHVNGGALTADGCDKLTRHLQLCDLFNIPVLNLVDNPGFAVGLDHEITGTIRKGGEWMLAFARITVPIFTVLMRRSFGVAGNNFATPRSDVDVRVAWPAADLGGIPPEGGIEAAYKRQLAEADDPAAFRAELLARIESVRGPLGPLNRFEVEELIDPRDTRRYVCEWIDRATQIATHPNRLAPRGTA